MKFLAIAGTMTLLVLTIYVAGAVDGVSAYYGLTETCHAAAASDPWGRSEGWASGMGTSW